MTVEEFNLALADDFESRLLIARYYKRFKELESSTMILSKSCQLTFSL
jgi:hypothetical protein